MPRYVATTRGVGRILPDSSVDLIAPTARALDDLLLSRSPEELARMPAEDSAPLEDLVLTSPVRRPSKVWAVGWAYADHAAEVGRERRDSYPILFLKASSSIAGPYDDIRLPAVAPGNVDFEGEIAIVIGREAKDIDESEALGRILGFAAANDVSARDVQKGKFNADSGDPSKAKSFDTFTPLGPSVCTLDEYSDPTDVGLTTTVDGEQRQSTRSSLLIHGIAGTVAFASRFGALLPGDLILTGTPAGVGHKEGRFLSPGSVVRVEVEGAGAIENQIVA